MIVMISQPMNGLKDEQIIETKEKASSRLIEMGYTVLDTFFTEAWTSEEGAKERGIVNRPVEFLAKSIESMSKCHAVYFCKGWKETRGCRIEHDIANAYGLKIIYEES